MRLKLLTIVDSSATNSPSFFMGYVWTGGKNGNKLLSCQKKRYTCAIDLLLMFKPLKWNVFTILYTKMWYLYADSVNLQPININLSVDCYRKLIPINNHMNLPHWLVIDYRYQSINWYRLVLIDIDYHWLSISSIVYPRVVVVRGVVTGRDEGVNGISIVLL